MSKNEKPITFEIKLFFNLTFFAKVPINLYF